MRKVFLGILVTGLIIPFFLQAQPISGIVNSYYKVSEVHTDYIQMEAGADLSGLQRGDKVVLIQMTGVNVPQFPRWDTTNLSYTNFGNAGRYEMIAISNVDDALDQVEVTVPLDDSKYTMGEKIQLVKIYEADYASVEGILTVPGWDGNTGGILAMVIYKKLTLNADININYTGFREADPETLNPIECHPDYSPDTFYYSPGISGKAGRKGEGNIKASFDYPTGPGRLVTGGGGGLGYFAGGGGGSHYGSGGNGGRQLQGCDHGIYASGGLALTTGTFFYGLDRVTMGGGGGSSTEEGTSLATAGGDGGGIVILLIDTLNGNGHNIFNRGEPVSMTATAGGGGGGAGGAILLDVNVYTGNLNLSVQGGKGGNTSGSPYQGAGGGGGGGIIWHTGSDLPVNVSYDYVRGSGGISDGGGDYNGTNGSSGARVGNLPLPLNGFLFNSLVAPDTICAGMVPEGIRGSTPKGGTGSYTYTWLQSSDNVNWSPASGTNNLQNYFPSELVQPTYYTRVVESGSVKDTALSIEIYVHDSIEGNVLTIRDTLCYGNSPGTLTGGVLSGGNGIFQYLWQSGTDQEAWDTIAYTASFDEGDLQQSTCYRRIAISARVCIDISNIDTLYVIPLIDSNTFLREDTAICSGLNAGTVKMQFPTGGDDSYRMQWRVSTNDTDYSDIGGATGQDYSPGTLTADRFYKRIVNSGANDACRDTSVSFFAEVYPEISNNTIETDSTRYCAGDVPLPVTGQPPAGGDGTTYSFTWQVREPSESWSEIPGETGIDYTPSTLFEDTVEIRRVVESGRFSACIGNSNELQIDVIPYISNTLVSPDESICEGSVPLPFSEPVATGGAGIDGYLWESQLLSGGSWLPATGTNNLFSYSSPELMLSTLFRRAVTSQICTDYSNPVTITVFPAIGNNRILGPATQYTCFDSPKLLSGSSPSGGDPGGSPRYVWEKSPEATLWELAEGTNTGQDYTSPALNDTVFFRRIVLSGETDQCKDTTDAVLVRINSLPSGDIISGIDSICAGDILAVFYSGLQGPSPWTIVLGDESPVYTETGITEESGEIVFPVTESGPIRMLDLIDDSTCHADLDTNTGVVELAVFEVPVANAGIDTMVCGLVNTLSAIPSVGLGTWTGDDASFTDENNPGSQVEVGSYGTYIFYWTEKNWQCYDTDETEVIFFEQPDTPYAGDDQVLDYRFETILGADPPPSDMTGYWSFVSETNGDFEDSLLYNTPVSFPLLGPYELMWTVVNGVCPVASDRIMVTVNDLQVFTGFSPNGDDVNETFILKLSGRWDVKLIILDRWGNQVISLSGREEIIWDGTNKDGTVMPVGTYFYIITEDGKFKDSGYIELRK